jgi:hypothetical protein
MHHACVSVLGLLHGCFVCNRRAPTVSRVAAASVGANALCQLSPRTACCLFALAHLQNTPSDATLDTGTRQLTGRTVTASHMNFSMPNLFGSFG